MIAWLNIKDNNEKIIFYYDPKIYLEFRFYLEQERSLNIYKKKITHCTRAINVPLSTIT